MPSNSTPQAESKLSYSVDENECWIPRNKPGPGGYVYFRLNGKNTLAHRYMWEVANGPVPVGREIDHLCRNRGCCNPDHLDPVTREINSQRGSKAKMRPETIREMRELSAAGVINSVLALKFGVSGTHVGYIVQKKVWKNV